MTPRPSPDDPRNNLPFQPGHAGGRAALTCRYRCGNACAHEAANTSDNPYLGDVIATRVSRRSLLRAGTVLSAAGLLGSAAAAAPAPAYARPGGRADRDAPRGLRFEPVAPNRADEVVVPDGYESAVLIRWGDPVLAGAPEFNENRQSAAAQARQFGYNCDYLATLPLPHQPHQVLLVANHEYSDEQLMFAGYDAANPTREQVEIAWAAHGMTVIVLSEDRSGRLHATEGHALNRRITATTQIELSGPAAGSRLLTTTADPTGRLVRGTLNNCGGGITPWGTVLSGEENFDQYFAHGDTVIDPTRKARLARYGLRGGASERKWERFDSRFDLSQEPDEANRHGWIVEIDPHDPASLPCKRTALGRFKHEAAEPRVGRDGRVALYMGDDARFEYFYKFVTTDSVKPGNSHTARRHNMGLLDNGTLYVATFTGDSPPAQIDGSGALPADGAFDGSGEWIALASGGQSFVPGMSAEEVYTFTRLAADKVGATKMDRPEDVEPHPRTGTVYVALTNNTDRGAAGKPDANEPNPRTGNRHGQVLELNEAGNDPTALTFQWRLLLVCGDPDDPSTHFAGFPKDQVSPISCPDNIAFDRYGNLWLATDGNALGANDGLFGVAVDGTSRGQVKQFLTVPIGAETCGPIIDERRVMVAVQHPGEVDGASVENPASVWPSGPGHRPRPSVVIVTRTGHGNDRIGTG